MRKIVKNLPVVKVTALISILFLQLSLSAHADEKMRVALYVDSGASTPAKANFKELLGRSERMNWRCVLGDDIGSGALKNFDALIVPGGSAQKEANSMGTESRDEVRRFVRDGGLYFGVCAGAYLSSEAKRNDLGLLPISTLDQEHWYRVDDGTPVDIELTPAGMDVFGLKDSRVKIIYENGPIFGKPIDKTDPSFTPLGFYRSEVVARGGERGVMLGAPSMILSRYGKGLVLACSPHPEKTEGLRWIILHALEWMYQHRTAEAPAPANKAGAEQHGGTGATSSVSAREAATGNEPARRQPAVSTRPETQHVSATNTPQRQLEPVANANTTGTENLSLGQRALKVAETVFDHATRVDYSHREVPAADQVITADDGTVDARTDCSGFISYVVHKVAPRHYKVIRTREPGHRYPQAKVWARFFCNLGTEHAQDGWLGIGRWQDLEPGDVIAWKTGNANAKNTGHVMMVASKPGQVQQENGVRFIEVPVIDSSSVYHFAPEYLPPESHQKHRNGLGKGRVRILLSETGTPIGYWEGTYWGEGGKDITHPTLSNEIGFGRLMPLEGADDR
jgi:hypothetical protein